MNVLSLFLATCSDKIPAELARKGGYIKFSNSGKRGEQKSFHIGLETLCHTLQNIKDHLNEFQPIQSYQEKEWRDMGANLFENEVVKSMITVQTKALFSTLNKLIMWANPGTYKNVDYQEQMVISEETLTSTLSKLQVVINSYTPNTNRLTHTLSRQKVFFGPPGCGKSYRISNLIAGETVRRTTFHPDSDYASFVGCYKPTMSQHTQSDWSFEDLMQRVHEVSKEENPIEKFTLKYHRSISRLKERPERVELCRRLQETSKKESYSAGTTHSNHRYHEMAHALALAEFLAKEGCWQDNSEITYTFVPQVFTNTYAEA